MASIRILGVVFVICIVINGLLAATTVSTPTAEPTNATTVSTTAEPTTADVSNVTGNATELPTTSEPDNSTTEANTTESTTTATNQTATPVDGSMETTTPACTTLSRPRSIPNFPKYFQICLNGELVTRKCPPSLLFTDFFGTCVPRRFYAMLRRWLRMLNKTNGGLNTSGESALDD